MMGRAVCRILRCTIRAFVFLFLLRPPDISEASSRHVFFAGHSPVQIRSSKHDVENRTAAAVLAAAAAVGDDARARRAAGEQFAGRVRDMAGFKAAGHAAEKIAERGAVKRAATSAATSVAPSKVRTAAAAARRSSLWKRALDRFTPKTLRRTATGASGRGAVKVITSGSRVPSKTAGLFTRIGAAGERTSAAAGMALRSSSGTTAVAVAQGAGAARAAARQSVAVTGRSAGRAASVGATGGLKRAAESAVTGATRRTALRGSGGGAAAVSAATRKAAGRAEYRSHAAAGSGAVERAALRGAVRRQRGRVVARPIGRMGRRALAAVPLVGLLFAVQACVQDRNRCVAEFEESTMKDASDDGDDTVDGGGGGCPAGMLFGFAAISGAVDVLAHAYIAVAMLAGWTAHGQIAAAERVSFWVAVASMVLAVMGELSSNRRRCEQEG